LLIGCVLAFLNVQSAMAQTTAPSPYELRKQETNQITVSIVVSGMSCTCARFAEDIRNVVNDLSPNGLRVLPILGVGGIQNLEDLLFLRGVDMATVDQDHIEYLKKKNPVLYANLENRVNYITKLYNSEFHVAAREGINSLADLQGKRVSFNLENSHTHIAADIIFEMLGVKTVKSFHDNNDAIELLLTDRLDAHIVLTGAPQSALAKLKHKDGIHFLPLSEEDLPSSNRSALYQRYLPADLTHEHYPELIETGKTVPTIATRTVLAVYNWEENSFRYRKLEKFVQEFFGKISKFNDKSRHPKWSEVNLNVDVPSWKRFKPAQDWLDGNKKVASTSSLGEDDEEMRAAFERFLKQYQASGKKLTPKDRDVLYTQFKQFLAFQQNAQSENR
jgi:TRAP transporter TAXI family solute receptor